MIVVVTGGGTTAAIDEVRHVANASTGRFSAEISEAWLESGAVVHHVHAPGASLPFDRSARLDLDRPDFEAEVDRLRDLKAAYESIRDRLRLHPIGGGSVLEYARVLEAVVKEQAPDLIFLAMAASDFEPIPTVGKLDSRAGPILVRFEPTAKVIRSVRDWAPDAYLVGFKLLTSVDPADLIAAAERSNRENRLDLTVANDLTLLRAGLHTLQLVRPGRAPQQIGPGGPIARNLVDRTREWSRTEFDRNRPDRR